MGLRVLRRGHPSANHYVLLNPSDYHPPVKPYDPIISCKSPLQPNGTNVTKVAGGKGERMRSVCTRVTLETYRTEQKLKLG